MNLLGNLPIFITNFLSLRRFRVHIGVTLSDFFLPDEGVPKSNVLRVTLFSIKINGILKQLPSAVCSSLYVDDLHISCQGKDMRFNERQLQIAINHITSLINENVYFSTNKTSCLHFCWLRDINPDPEIIINSR